MFFSSFTSKESLVRIAERFKALRFLAPVPVEHQIASNGEEPSFEFPFAVVLRAAFEYAHPGFLEKIFGAFAASGQVQQIAEQPELVLLDKKVEQLRVALLQAASDGF